MAFHRHRHRLLRADGAAGYLLEATGGYRGTGGSACGARLAQLKHDGFVVRRSDLVSHLELVESRDFGTGGEGVLIPLLGAKGDRSRGGVDRRDGGRRGGRVFLRDSLASLGLSEDRSALTGCALPALPRNAFRRSLGQITAVV